MVAIDGSIGDEDVGLGLASERRISVNTFTKTDIQTSDGGHNHSSLPHRHWWSVQHHCRWFHSSSNDERNHRRARNGSEDRLHANVSTNFEQIFGTMFQGRGEITDVHFMVCAKLLIREKCASNRPRFKGRTFEINVCSWSTEKIRFRLWRFNAYWASG